MQYGACFAVARCGRRRLCPNRRYGGSGFCCCACHAAERGFELTEHFYGTESAAADLERAESKQTCLHQSGHLPGEVAEIESVHECGDKFLCHLCARLGNAGDVRAFKVDFLAFERREYAGYDAVGQFARAFAEL